jgi:hypothetical protein
MTAAEKPHRPAAKEDERLAYHEAAHAVAMWKLGYGIDRVTIDPSGDGPGHAKPASSYDLESVSDEPSRRFVVEQDAMVLHAGRVAEQLLHPRSQQTLAFLDHDQIHREMQQVEDDKSIQITWCNYLWQRTYTLLARPAQWKLIVALARELLTYRTLDGRSAELYLKGASEFLRHDSSIPNAVLAGEVTYVCSPWHRAWHSKSLETISPAMSTDLPECIENMEWKPDFRPVRLALGPLSARAQRCLDRAEIRSIIDLAYWSPRALSSIPGAGKLTTQEIVDAAASAGAQIAPDDAPMPWVLDPKRWR